jgi:EAL domain-containing protein (putative c-di-GMP-specific phosphodiesterase class I)
MTVSAMDRTMDRTEERGALTPSQVGPARVLLVDDDPGVLESFSRVLERAGNVVRAVSSGARAAAALRESAFDVVVTDIRMPNLDGIALLKVIRDHDAELPVVVMTGAPALETAIAAVEHGACHYLLKPPGLGALEAAVAKAVERHRLAVMRRQGERSKDVEAGYVDRGTFSSALELMWMAYQPLVRWSTREVCGYEALVRSSHPHLGRPDLLLGAAERLGRLPELGRRIRALVVENTESLPRELSVFVNLHPSDLMDEALTDPTSPFVRQSGRFVLEITERAQLDDIADARHRVASLRLLGFRIAIDDLGAGHAGLASISQLEPEIVKLDMSLVRNVHNEPIKLRLVRSVVASCRDMGFEIIAEGVETPAERDALAEIGCDVMQGYLFARPAAAFPRPRY